MIQRAATENHCFITFCISQSVKKEKKIVKELKIYIKLLLKKFNFFNLEKIASWLGLCNY